MSLRILVDMNLSPNWVSFFRDAGYDAVHWIAIGRMDAKDREIMEWAETNGHIVLTNDLDFGALLALTRHRKPSVVQMRCQDLMPESSGELLRQVLKRFEGELSVGALLTIDESNQRVRLLPIVS